MRKAIFIFLILIIIYFMDVSTDIGIIINNVDASSTIVSKEIVEDYILEEVVDYNKKRITIKSTIPETYNNNIAEITPKVFEAIKHYRLLNSKNKRIIVDIIIDNKTKNTYRYIQDSLFIGPPKVNNQILYRTNNEAIKNLYNNKIVLLDDNNLSIKLKEKGYKDITELNKFYLDYYNSKFKIQSHRLSNNMLKEIYKYQKSKIIESNKELVEESYRYYYSEILKLKINNIIYSIEDAAKYYINDSELIYNLGELKCNSKSKISFIVFLDDDYNNLFKEYVSGYIEFKLEKMN